MRLGSGSNQAPCGVRWAMGTICCRCASKSVSLGMGALAGDQAKKWHNDSYNCSGGDWRGKAGRERGLGMALPESRIHC